MDNIIEIDDFISLKDREFYEYYKKNRKSVSKGVERYADWSRAVARLMLSIKDLMIETEGGVFVEKLGYFAIFKTYKKTDKKKKNGSLSTYIKDYRYYPYFFGEVSNPIFKGWFMSMMFTPETIKDIKEQLQKGFKYQLHLTTVKSLIKANKETRKSKK